jgi:O-6-methylguanine DNA methyltransferase
MSTPGTFTTPWGPLTLDTNAHGAHRVVLNATTETVLDGYWATVLTAYLAGQPIPADIPVDLTGMTPFTRAVLEACRTIPFGGTMSYGQLAVRLGRPGSARAVGRALASNPLPLLIPCHRVVGAHGALTGFLGGLAWKRGLLEHEGIKPGGRDWPQV